MFWTVFGAVLGLFCGVAAFVLLVLGGLWFGVALYDWWNENRLRFRR